MLDIKYIRENKEAVQANIQRRGSNADVQALVRLDENRRERIAHLDALRHSRKQASKQKPREEDIQELRVLGERIKQEEAALARVEKEYGDLLAQVPNMTHPDVTEGGENDFRVVEAHGKKPSFSFEPTDHETILTNLGMIDFERGTKVAGAKFYFAIGDLVTLQQALIRYGIDTVQKRGYMLMETPDVAKDAIISGIGFQPRGPESQMYGLEDTDLSLIGTAEITIGGFHADEVLDLAQSPIKIAALSHCFRTEAGAYGRTSKGLYRVHQFTKLEMFLFCKPEESDRLHQELLDIEKEIADGLGLHYRVIDIASCDLGAPAYRKFDLEAWMVMKNDFGEITSTSNCTDYQARNLNIKYRKTDGTTDFVHTLNGTAIVTSRMPIAIVEQYQKKDGSIEVPKALRKYVGKKVLWGQKKH